MANWLDVSDVTPRIQYVANGSQTVFTVPFLFFDNTDLAVSIDGLIKTLGVHYTVSGAQNEFGGTVTFLVAPAAGDVVLIVRAVPLKLTTHIPPSGPLDIPGLNLQFSRLVAMLQQEDDTLQRLRIATLTGLSFTSVTIGTGSKTFTTQPGKQFSVGEVLVAVSNADPANFMRGTVTAYDTTTGALTVNVTATGGSGTFADWLISVALPHLLGFKSINVRDYGAVGDGVTDDRAAIQAAIEAAAAIGDATDSSSALDGVFVDIDCGGATWGIGSPGLSFTSANNIVMRGGRFKAVGAWGAALPMFDINGSSSLAVANLTFRDIQFDGDRKANGFSVQDAPRCRFENVRGNRYLDYGFLFGLNVWGACLIDPVLHEWDSDDANLENLALRLADGIRINGGLDVRVIGGFIGFNKRGVACLSGGFGFNFIGTHIYDSALVTPQEHDIVFAEAGTSGMQFDHCYLDTGWTHLKGLANHNFFHCRFFRNAAIAPAGLTAYIHLEATAAGQGLSLRLVGNYFEDSAGTPRPVFKLTETGGNTYVFNKGTFTTAGHDQWVGRGSLNLTSTGNEDTPSYLRSGHATASLQAFAGLSTTVSPKAGADGNDYVIQVNGAERARLSSTALTTLDGVTITCTTSADFGTPFVAVSTQANANHGPQLLLDRVSASPLAADNIGSVPFGGRDSGGNFTNYAEVGALIIDPTNGSEDGRLSIDVQVAGVQTTIADFGPFSYLAHQTTVSAANAFLDTGSTPANELKRSTSSLRYKRDVEPLEAKYSNAILGLTPIWYRSKCAGDNQGWSWYGLGAEDVAAIDPRLVHWGYAEEDYDEHIVELPPIRIEKKQLREDGTEENVVEVHDGGLRRERTLREGARLVPDGVQYERLTVLLLDIVKRQEARIAALEARP